MRQDFESRLQNIGQLTESRPTLRDRIERERVVLRERLKDLDEAAAALAGNPELERLLNLVSRV